MAERLNLPRMSDTMEEGVIADVKIKVGDKLKAGDVIAEVETDKATMEWESFVEGEVLYVAVKSGDTVPVEGLVAIIGKKGEDYKSFLVDAPKDVSKGVEEKVATNNSANTVVEKIVVAESPLADNGRLKASPLAKSIAKEKGIDLSQIQGSGEDGRIVKRDVENAKSSGKAMPQFNVSAGGDESYEEMNVSQMRKTIARRLAESKFGAPHFYLGMEINMDRAMQARSAANEMAEHKISFNDMIIKAVALALKKHPKVNSSWLGDKIRINHYVNIGMAVAVDEGLLVPVIKHADLKPLSLIAAEAKSFAEKARTKKLQPEEMQGNTFTISNLGMMGIDEFTAIINPPDACILAVGGIKQVPKFENGNWVPVNVMKVTMSCDHRVVDGAVGSAFLNTFKAYMEEPLRMLV